MREWVCPKEWTIEGGANGIEQRRQQKGKRAVCVHPKKRRSRGRLPKIFLFPTDRVREERGIVLAMRVNRMH